MDKRTYIYIFLSLLFFGLAFFKDIKNTKEYNLTIYTQEIQQTLNVHEEQAGLVTKAFAENAAILGHSDKFQSAIGNQSIEDLAKKPFTILLFKGEQLLAWSNNRTVVSANIQEGFVQLNEGYYHVSKKFYSDDYQCVTLIPIKWHYKIDNQEYLKNCFIASEIIPELVEITQEVTPFSVTSSIGKSLYLDAKGNATSANAQYQIFILLLIGLIFLCALVNNISRHLSLSTRPGWSLIFFFLSAFFIKYIITFLDFNTRFTLLPLFDKRMNGPSVFDTSPGDMLVNIFLLLWLIIFFYRDVKPFQFEKLSFRVRIVLNIIFNITIILGLLTTIYFHKGLIMNTKEDFDFENIYYIKFSGVVTVMSLLLLWVVLFLFNYRIMSNIRRLEIPAPYRIGLLVLSIALVYPLVASYEFNIPLIFLSLFIFAFVTALDFFTDSNNESQLPWLLVWLIIFSFTSAVLLYKYRRDSDSMELSNLIKVLSIEKDQQAFEALNSIVRNYKVEKDSTLTRDQILLKVTNLFNDQNYLVDNYRFALSDSLFKGNIVKPRILTDKDSTTVYAAQILVDSTHFYRLEMQKQKMYDFTAIGDSKSIMRSEPYLGIKELDKIEYAVFKNRTLKESNTSRYMSVNDIVRTPKVNACELSNDNMLYMEYVGHYENDLVIVARHSYDGGQKIVFLFAYLFIFIAGIAFFIAVLNTFTDVIDGFKFPRHWTMNFKVHATIIGLVLFACIVVACVTFIHSNNTAEQSHHTQLEQKMQAIISHIEGIINKTPDEKINFQDLLEPLTRTHQVDVNFYDLTGHLITNLDKIVFKKYLKAPIINSIAYDNLMHQKKDAYFTLGDHIGNFSYESGFARIEKNNQLVALIEVPNYSREWLKQNDLSNLMGMLMTVYVLLLIPTIIFAYSTTKLIMKPLQEVGEKLREVGYGVAPTKIEWNSKDELGELIGEYNTMLLKLQESKIEIEEDAKESAWRVMAKQVSHEIKNPLTPMKLRTQMLNSMAQNAGNEELREYVIKTTRTLEEQIAALDGIATSFGDYAGNIDGEKAKLQLEEVNFGDFVTVNASLFEDNEHPNTKLNIVVPFKENLFVKIDRTQMVGVLNNLIKNAIQAIPDYREGRVDVFVTEQDGKVLTRICDNGIGIPKELLAKIFMPNFTTKGKGSGIGLAVSFRSVKDVQGNLWCESVLGQGSDFFIELPLEYKM
jgi:two-component system, NtrC family, nitrogen regulation sensor histidine kinase NtrY